MSPEAPPRDAHAADLEHVPPVEVLLTDVIARLALAAHVYLAEEEGKTTDLSSAEAAIDVAASTFERIKERLRPQERLTITQLLTETRLTFVRKRGL
mgnify:CR=1 FL=1